MDLIEGVDYFIRYIKLPVGFAGCVLPNDDGTYSVYVDQSLPQEEQAKTVLHELEHLERGHFDVGVDPVEAERELVENKKAPA